MSVDILNQCWEWNGARTDRGYGHKVIGRRHMSTHRLAYEWANGPIPPGLHVLHTCDNPPCCNPNHLRLGTQHENLIDMVRKGRHHNKSKTHCPQGHPYQGKNLVLLNNGTKRKCRVCMRHFAKARYWQTREVRVS
jgi:hypothetical protein